MFIYLGPETIQLLNEFAAISAKVADAEGADKFANEHEIAAAHDAASAVLASYLEQLDNIKVRGAQLIQLSGNERVIVAAAKSPGNPAQPVEILIAREGGDLAMQITDLQPANTAYCDVLFEHSIAAESLLMHIYNSEREDPALMVSTAKGRQRRLHVHGSKTAEGESHNIKIK